MNLLISVYKEDFDSGRTELAFCKWVYTDWSTDQIDKHFELYDGFRSEMTLGNNLSFWDIYCFFADTDDLERKIKSIPNQKRSYTDGKDPVFLRVSEYNPGNTDTAVYPDMRKVFLYSLDRYECGASGYEAVVYWMANHPIAMIFISGIIYDTFKSLVVKVLKRLGIWCGTSTKRPIIFAVKKFYKNFEKLTHIQASNAQIVQFKRLKTGMFSLIVRTTANEKFKVRCSALGTIDYVERVS